MPVFLTGIQLYGRRGQHRLSSILGRDVVYIYQVKVHVEASDYAEVTLPGIGGTKARSTTRRRINTVIRLQQGKS